MTQNNFRKEPIFGNTSATEGNVSTRTKQIEINSDKTNMSLHSTQSPGYTFTPIMTKSNKTTETLQADSVESTKEFQFTPRAEGSVVVNATGSDESSPFVDRNETKSNEHIGVVASEATTNEGLTAERVMPNKTATTATVNGATATTLGINETLESKMPTKTRRLLLVALIVLALLVIFFLLKPRTPETVEELQSQQGRSLPIEFRPVDENEAKRAEEQARVEQEIEQQQQDVRLNQQAQQIPEQAENQVDQGIANQAQTVAETNVVKPAVNKEATVQSVTKPKTQDSVVYQPEAVTSKPKSPLKVEQEPVTSQKHTTHTTKAKATAKPKPIKTESVRTASATSSATTATKTMTIPKGVSLMQVFRDNNLNISDVNAMSKVNNIVSNLKAGERITVRLDKNKRVVEMSIGSRGVFTRQANGNYTFK